MPAAAGQKSDVSGKACVSRKFWKGLSPALYDRIAEKPIDRKWKGRVDRKRIHSARWCCRKLAGAFMSCRTRHRYDLIYNQPVINPRWWDSPGRWISGGIEFNWPQHHRRRHFCQSIQNRENADGSKHLVRDQIQCAA